MTNRNGQLPPRRSKVYGAGLLSLVVACSSLEILDSSKPQLEAGAGVSFHYPYQVTAGSESNFAPSLSPDGRLVVYTSERQGNKAIWRKKTSGGYAQALTYHSADDTAPLFSPDGDDIAFISRRFDAAGEVHIIDSTPAEGHEKDSRVIANKDYEDTYPAWYPDGERLIFASRKAGETAAQLMTASLSELTPKPLEDLRGSQPHVGPDGKLIVYVNAGALHLYNEENRLRTQLTSGGLVQDGQPRFSQDGKKILFIRYADDTNNDGNLDADDQPTLWELALPAALTSAGAVDGNKPPAPASSSPDASAPPEVLAAALETFALVPLTSADFAAYTPDLRGERLYFTKQTGLGLDIYYLPPYGQAKVPATLTEIREVWEARKTYHEKNYILRKAAAMLFQAGNREDAAEVAMWELAALVENRRSLEAAWLREKLRHNFAEFGEIQALAELAMLALSFASEAFPERQGELSTSARERLSGLFTRLDELGALGQSKQWPRVIGQARYQQGRLRATLGDYFAAQSDFVAVSGDYAAYRELQVAALLAWAQLLPHISSREAAIKKCMDLITAYPEQKQYSRKAAALATGLAEQGDEPVASLLNLREQAVGLPMLQALAHRRIADRFINEKRDVVAANELRQIVDSYPDSPELTIEAAETLAQIVETQGRIEEAEGILAALSSRLAAAPPPIRERARELYLDLLVRKGEKLLQMGQHAQALTSFKQVLAVESEHIAANRGLIDASYQLGTLDSLWEEWEASERPLTARALYSQGYATTYRIDEARLLGSKLSAIDDAIELIEGAREHDDQLPAIHQTLGWLYYQKHYWRERYEAHGGFAAYFGEGWNTLSSALIDLTFDYRVLNFFADEEPSWLELSIDSYLAAYALSEKASIDYGHIALNLAQSYYMLGNFKKALHYYLERIALLPLLPVREPRAEGLLWQRAGRAAFQGGELALAASLQNKALTTWETLNAGEQINYALDALALTLREEGSYAAAGELYQKLITLQKAAHPSANFIKSVINLAYCRLKAGELDAANSLLAEAEAALQSPVPAQPNTSAGEIVSAPSLQTSTAPSPPSSSSSQPTATTTPLASGTAPNETLAASQPPQALDYGARDRAVGLAFYYEQMLLIETLRGAIYQEQGQSANLAASYRRKRAIVEAKKQWGSDEGEADTYQLFELSILHNQQGNLALRLGRLDAAKANFQQALAFSEELQQASAPLSDDNLLNLFNVTKVELHYADAGKVVTSELKTLQGRLVGIAGRLNQQAADKKSEEPPAALAKVFALLGLVGLHLPPGERQAPPAPYSAPADGESAPPAPLPPVSDPLTAALGMWQRQHADLAVMRSPLLALAAVQTTAPQEDLQPLFRSFRRQASAELDAYWPYLAQKGQWLSAFEALESAQAQGTVLNQRSERLMARDVFERYLTGLGVDEVLPALQRYHRLKLQDLAARSLQAPQAFFHPDPATVPPPTSSAPSPTAGDAGSAAGSSAPLPPYAAGLKALLTIKDVSLLQAALPAHQALIGVHRAMRSGQTWVVLIRHDKVAVERMVIADSARLTSAPYRELLARLPLTGIKGLYVVPSDELYRLDWEGICGGILEGQLHGLSFLPSFDALPELRGKEKKEKILLAHWGQSALTEVDPKAPTPAGPTPLATPAALASTSAPTPPAAVAPGAAGDLLTLTYTGQKTALSSGQELSAFHLLNAATPLTLNGIAPGQSFWSMAPYDSVAPPPANQQLSLADWAQLKLPNTAVVLFPHLEQVIDSSFQYEGDDAWLALSLALFHAGVPTLALAHTSKAADITPAPAPPPSGPASSKGPLLQRAKLELTPAFYQSLMRRSLAASVYEHKLNLRSLGLMASPAPAPESLAAVITQHEEGYEDASADSQWQEASVHLLALLYYQKLAGNEARYWENLSQLVMLFYRLQKYAYALRLQEIVVAHLAAQEGDEAEHAAGLVMAATLALLAEQHAASEGYLAQAATYFNAEEEWTQMATIWHYRALNAEKQQRYDQAIAAYEEAIGFFAKDDADKEIALKYKAIAGIYQIRLNQYDKALAYLDKAAAIFVAAKDDQAMAELKIEQANIYISLDRAKQAITLLAQVLASIAKEEAVVPWLRTSQNLANAYLRAGSYTDAHAGNEATLATLHELADDSERLPAQAQKLLLVDALNLKGMVLGMKAQYDKAFASLDEAITLARSLKAEGRLAFLYNNYGFWLRESGKIKESITYFERALAIDERLAAQRDIAFDLRNLGLSTLVLGHTSLARQYLERSLAISRELGITYNTIYCHFGLADIALKEQATTSDKDRQAKALALATSQLAAALDEAERKNLLEFRWKALAASGRLHASSAEPAKALPFLAKAVELIEMSPPGLKRQSSPTGLASEVGTQSVYELYIAALMQAGRAGEAWAVSEKAKLRRIVDSLGNDKLPLSHAQHAPLLTEFRTLKEQLGSLRQQLSNPQTPAGSRASLQAKVQSVAAAYQLKAGALHAQDPQAYYLYATDVPTAERIKALVPAESALLAYQVNDDATYVWLFRQGAMHTATIPIPRNLIKRKVEDFRLMIEHYSTTRYLGKDLADILLAPVAKGLAGVNNLVVVPHLWLHHLAFAALNYESGYMVDRFNLSYLESAAFLPLALAAAKEPALGSQSTILALANPSVAGKPALPFAEKEVSAMARYYPHLTALVGAAARKDELTAATRSYDILHVASHGTFDATTPAESSLLLAGDGASGSLKALEAFALPLSPKLVTLSACQSALSVLTSGEDVLSLQRGFFYRGAQAVVGSLWRIDDVTSGVVMKRFYRNLAAGVPLASALRQSQLTVKSHFAHPAYWAAFKLSGRYH